MDVTAHDPRTKGSPSNKEVLPLGGSKWKNAPECESGKERRGT